MIRSILTLTAISCLTAKAEFVPANITHLLKDQEASEKTLKVDGVPFAIREGQFFPLAEASWPEREKDPSNFYEEYDAGKNVPLFQVPRGDYVAAWLLARAGEGEQTSNHVTLRAGRRIGGAGVASQVVMVDFMGTVPRGKEGWKAVRIPFSKALAQDIEGEVMDIEITKELRLAVRSPDPARFRWRPLGLPSSVEIAGITLERSPLQFELRAGTEGSLFEAPARPQFTARLQNITGDEQTFKLEVLVNGEKAQMLEGTVPAGASIEKQIELPEQPLGHHTLEVAVHNAQGKLFSRSAFFGSLPADTRKFRAESPVGTWQFDGTHFTPKDYGETGALYRKLGFRYGLFAATPELRKEMGVIRGNEYSIRGNISGEKALEGWEKVLATHPDVLRTVLLFHEDSVSGLHVTRVPDLFHDHPPYQLNAEEKKRFDEMVKTATEGAKAIRAKYPEVKFSLGNGPLPLREEFYRNKFPADLFDFAGNEPGSFGRPPETQPPDGIANNASLWMDRQMLDAYGYSDKAIHQCYEITYPGTNPGNLSYQTQADYFIRHILHSMAWRMPQIRVGGIVDVGNSYYFGNWGSSSFFTARPRIEPKPAAVAVATLTTALDGAVYDRFVETGSESAYLLRFRKKDDSLMLPHWVVRGVRDFHVKLEGELPPTLRLIAGHGEVREVPVRDGQATFRVSPTPGYLELPAGVQVVGVTLGQPEYADAPSGKVSKLDALSSLEGWRVETKRNPALETYNPMTPRRKGDFAFEEAAGAIRVTPRPLATGKPTMPMYAEMVRKESLVLPGEPAEIGLWVDGNSSWGRIIFELEDASGQRWTSIGAKAQEGGSDWMRDWVGKDLAEGFTPGEIADWNTDDQFGVSRINFDGWRYVSFPLPGQYPGEGYHWPSNSQWKFTGDGVVHYPLRLTKVIVELPEKTLYLDRYEPARRPAIALRDLVSVENSEINNLKTTPAEYVEAAQHDMR